MKRNNNNKKGSKKRRQAMTIQKFQRNIFGKALLKLVSFTDYISSTTGSSSLTFALSGAAYCNLTNLTAQNDYTDMIANHFCMRLRRVRIVITRVVSENAVQNVYSAGVMPTLFIGFYPTINSSASNQVSFTETSLQIHSFLVNPVSREWSVPNVYSRYSGDSVINVTKWTSVSAFTNIPGQFQVGQTSSLNAATTTRLYAINVIGEFEFAIPS